MTLIILAGQLSSLRVSISPEALIHRPRVADQIREMPVQRVFWIYLLGAVLITAGFVDYSLVAYHFIRSAAVPNSWTAIFYSVAVAVSGVASLIPGRLFDQYRLVVLVILSLISAAFVPLIFLVTFGWRCSVRRFGDLGSEYMNR